ncbi:MAG: hypothetical protein LBL48_05655 [Azoarcus sp.]|nr:hypothetical protein [Azoarcus sp.]
MKETKTLSVFADREFLLEAARASIRNRKKAKIPNSHSIAMCSRLRLSPNKGIPDKIKEETTTISVMMKNSKDLQRQ